MHVSRQRTETWKISKREFTGITQLNYRDRILPVATIAVNSFGILVSRHAASGNKKETGRAGEGGGEGERGRGG
jgi:hypothetical protein